MNGKRKRDVWSRSELPLPVLLLLAFFFLLGVILGQVLMKYVPDATGQELKQYLQDYVQLERGKDQTSSAFFSTLFLYFRYPLLAYLAGFASIGVLLLPGMTMAFGFFLSFSICCFTATFGTDGVLLALAVLGLRCAVTLPCYFLLAIYSWKSSSALASLSFGRGRRIATVHFDRSRWYRFGAISSALFLGVCLDLFLSPWFLQLVLQRLQG